MSRAGSVFRRGAGWGYRVDLAPPGAPRNQRMQQGFRTKREAQLALDEAKAQLAAGTLVSPTRVSVTDWAEQWASSLVAKGLAPSTRNDYLSKISTYLLPTLGDRPIQSIVATDLDSLYARMLSAGARDGSPLSPRTVRAFHVVARLLFDHAVRHGVIARNPVRSATPPSTTAAAAREPQVWTREQLAQFLRANETNDRYPLWRLMALTGLRRGEVIGLQWGDLDLTARTLRVRRAVAVVNGALAVGKPKSQRSRRVVALDPGTVEILQHHAARQRERLDLLGVPVTDETPVFDDGLGDMLHSDAIGSAFRRAVGRAGVPKIRLHDLRHTHASHLVAAGESMRVVSERLGHSSVGFTMDTYAHVMPGQQDHAAALAAELVDSVGSTEPPG